MKAGNKHNGIAIALAWPETLCKQAGAWYEGLMTLGGFNVDGYYKVGHAAIILIDKSELTCHYFDFGRYHAPHGSGRVRDANTDHDLRITTKAVLSANGTQIINLDNILSELFNNSSTHGTGVIYGNATDIDFDMAHSRAVKMQEQNFIEYGPFLPKGTNCSRFVNSVLIAGKPGFIQQMKLMIPLTVSPTPMWNLRAIGGETHRFGLSINQTDELELKINPDIIEAA